MISISFNQKKKKKKKKRNSKTTWSFAMLTSSKNSEALWIELELKF